jgi:DNA-binding response OmpR family regulator
MRILIIEDEKELARILKQGLQEHAFTVDLAFDGQEGLYMAETYPFDVLIVDIMLPRADGFTIVERLRSKNNDVPVLILTAKGEVEHRVKGLNKGADDYIAKPFDFSELLARIKALIRRHKGTISPLIQIDDLVINLNSHVVNRRGEDIKLSAKEFAILRYLALNKGKVISRTELMEHVYDTESEYDSNVIDVYINYIRNKMDRGYSKQLLRTIRGAGYILTDSSDNADIH